MRGPGFMTSNTSKTVYVKMAPWRMSSLVPRALRSAAEPGMAKTSRPYFNNHNPPRYPRYDVVVTGEMSRLKSGSDRHFRNDDFML